MSIADIKALPVSDIAARDCALFMWITFPCLQEAMEVLSAWGFEYKTVAFVWIKQNRKSDSLFWGMGYWTRANAELCILATRGHPKRQSHGPKEDKSAERSGKSSIMDRLKAAKSEPQKNKPAPHKESKKEHEL